MDLNEPYDEPREMISWYRSYSRYPASTASHGVFQVECVGRHPDPAKCLPMESTISHRTLALVVYCGDFDPLPGLVLPSLLKNKSREPQYVEPPRQLGSETVAVFFDELSVLPSMG